MHFWTNVINGLGIGVGIVSAFFVAERIGELLDWLVKKYKRSSNSKK